MAAQTFISLENLSLNNELIKQIITTEDAKSLKTVAISPDGKKLLFYRASEPIGITQPVYEIEFPETDITGLMQKVIGAVEGNILVAKNDGNSKDSGVKIADIAIKTEVAQQIAAAVTNAGHITKQIVTKVPDAADAKENVIYMLKVSSATGNDKYQEWQLIGNEMVMTGDTSVDLSGYALLDDVISKIATAKAEAIAEAKSYVDTEIGKVNTTLGTVQGKLDVNTADIGNLKTSVTSNAESITSNLEKITALEGKVGDGYRIATEDEIRALFT